jgi:hypothetical protein
MNQKKAKRLRRQADRLALQTALAAEEKGMALRYDNTRNRIYNDLKKSNINDNI